MNIHRAPSEWLNPMLNPNLQTLTLGFGKHADQTYVHVMTSRPDYCRWILRNCGPDKSQALCDFAEFLRANFQDAAAPATPVKAAATSAQPQTTGTAPHTSASLAPVGGTILGFGKHADETYAHVMASRPDYCRWILRNCGPDKSQALCDFAEFLRANFQDAAAPATPVKAAATSAQPQTPPTILRASASLAPAKAEATLPSWQPAPDTLLSSIKYAIVDTETTGLLSKDRVVEVAVQCITGDGRTLAPMFTSLVNPGSAVNMSSEAAKITGITNDMIHAAGVPSFATLHPLLMKRLEGCVIVAHNAAFDRRMITQSCDGQLLPPIQPWLCTLRHLSQRMLPLSHHKLVDVCGHYGISINSAHRASGDVEALAKALPRLLSDAERVHGIHTWGDLQTFIQKKRSKQIAPVVVQPAAGSGTGSSSGGCSSSSGGVAVDGNSSRAEGVAAPKPYDAAAQCGAHPFDSSTKKWNGNMHGPKKKDGTPDMRKKENFD